MTHTMNITYKGKRPEDCTREELLELIAVIEDQKTQVHHFHESATVKALQRELEIKDQIIDKLCRGRGS